MIWTSNQDYPSRCTYQASNADCLGLSEHRIKGMYLPRHSCEIFLVKISLRRRYTVYEALHSCNLSRWRNDVRCWWVLDCCPHRSGNPRGSNDLFCLKLANGWSIGAFWRERNRYDTISFAKASSPSHLRITGPWSLVSSLCCECPSSIDSCCNRWSTEI